MYGTESHFPSSAASVFTANADHTRIVSLSRSLSDAERIALLDGLQKFLYARVFAALPASDSDRTLASSGLFDLKGVELSLVSQTGDGVVGVLDSLFTSLVRARPLLFLLALLSLSFLFASVRLSLLSIPCAPFSL